MGKQLCGTLVHGTRLRLRRTVHNCHAIRLGTAQRRLRRRDGLFERRLTPVRLCAGHVCALLVARYDGPDVERRTQRVRNLTDAPTRV